ncbi:MAG: class I SAM-dependent methyltransferase [Thaumarchaeota archaeon]|nr:class I SAM-dependent methyltransferase [Nitrososphaerota archaeon]
MANYEKYDYRQVWAGKRLEDAAQKHIISSWLTPAERCLELGCGFGRITQILEPTFRDIFALEYTPRNLTIAKQRLKKTNLARADISRIPARDSSFDCVVMIRVIHLLPDPTAVLREVARVSKDGATVIISMPNLAMNNLLWAARGLRTRNSARGPFVWPYDAGPYFVPISDIAPSALRLDNRRGTGLLDNAAGKLLERFTHLYLLDVATSPLWFFKLDVFLKFRVVKTQGDK